MKKLLVIVTLVVCGAAIILGNIHWKNKISAHGEKEKSNNTVVVTEEESITSNDINTYSKNLPEHLQKKIAEAANMGKPVNLVIFGTSSEKEAWSEQLSKELKTVYGENVFAVTILSTGDKTTRDLVNDDSFEQVNELQPDILLFEPSMLKDNGVVGISNTLENIQTMIASWKAANKNITLMMQPPNPLYSASYYPKEVAQLQDYAENNKIIYLNHWENWPDLEDPKMQEYLTEDNIANEKGNKIWADYLIKYFIAK
ncbi:SGNH/GDSL hydrolase family protein [Metabacillus sp. Hm71]|uniref:SGNH/GDSL hydrolase family protein n=1 Tax=Metabacillus sp. Hm71 TaxID=3450743 RepID=UPI003F4438DB